MGNEDRVRKTVMVDADLCEALAEQKGDMTFTELFNRLAEAQVTKVIDVTTDTSTPELILASGMNRAIADRISAEAELMRAQAAALRKTEGVEDAPVEISLDEADIRQAVECIVAAVVEEQHADFVSRVAETLGEVEQMVNAMCERLNMQCDAATNLVMEETDEETHEDMEVDDGLAEATSYDSSEDGVFETDATEADGIEPDERGEEPGYDDSEPAEAEGIGSVEDDTEEVPDEEDMPETEGIESVEADKEGVAVEENDDDDGSGEGDVDVVTSDDGSSDGTAGGMGFTFESDMTAEVAAVTGDAGIDAIKSDIEVNGLLTPNGDEFSTGPEPGQYGIA